MIEIELPWPHKDLMPNAARRKHWAARGNLAAKYRADCHKLALTVPNRFSLPPIGKIPLHITFHEPDRRGRDWDGLCTAIKAGLDGIADALHMNDKRFRPVIVDVADEPVKGGKVVVRIEQACRGL